MVNSLIVGVTGASGAVYGVRLLEVLHETPVETHLVVSKWGQRTLEHETGRRLEDLRALADHHYGAGDMAALMSSGSAGIDGMVIAPCSARSLAAIACGLSENLIHRAADVMIKERRPLVLMVRETPLSAIHLENMLKLARLGVTILPPVPAFYNEPGSIDEIVDYTVTRALDQFGLKWGSAGVDIGSGGALAWQARAPRGILRALNFIDAGPNGPASKLERVRRRDRDGPLDIGDCPGHLAADQVHLADLLDARLDPVDFSLREDRLQDVAAIDEADEGDITRVWNLIREQHVRDALLRLLLDLAVDGRIAAGAKDPEELLFPTLQNAALHQLFQRGRPNRLVVAGGCLLGGEGLDPRSAVGDGLLARHPGQHAVEQGIARRGGVDDHHPLGVGIDPVRECQVHENRTCESAVEGVLAHRQEGAVLVMEKEHHDFFVECQHKTDSRGSG